MVRNCFSDNYKNVINQVLKDAGLLSDRIEIFHESLEIISIQSNSPVIEIIAGFLGGIITR